MAGRRITRPKKVGALGPVVVRVAIYLRVSTVKQLEGYGLDVQEEACRAITALKLAGRQHVILDLYIDGGFSGKLAHRPEFDRLNQDIADGKIDLVVFAKVDRIARKMDLIHKWVADTSALGVRIVTADGRIDSADENFKIMLSLFAWMADMEHVFILERTADGREAKLSQGGWAFGVAPYGYKLEGKGEAAKPVPNDDEVKVIAKAIELIVDLEMGETEAAEALTKDGMLTRNGKRWTGANLRRMLMRNALLGFVAVRDLEANGSRSEALMDEEGNFLHGDSYRIPLPEIIPADRVKAVRAALTRTSWSPASSFREYLLTGRLIGTCGKHYTGIHNKDRKDRSISYRCTGGNKNHANYVGCDDQVIAGPEIEELVWEKIKTGLQDREHLQTLAARWLGRIPDLAETYRKRIVELEEQISKKKSVKHKKIALLTAQVAMDDDFDEKVAEELLSDLKTTLQEQEDRLSEELDMNRRWLAEAELQEARVAEVMKLADEATPKLEGLSLQQKRDLMELLDIRVTVTAKAPRRSAVVTAAEKWFEEQKRPVPGVLTDEQWDLLEPMFPEPTNSLARARWVSRRRLLDAILYKVRHGLAWTEIPSEVYANPDVPKNYFTKWLKDGTWAQVIDRLGNYEGTALPSRVTLPYLHIDMAFKQVSGADSVITPGDFDEQVSRILFAEVTARSHLLEVA